MFPPMFLPYTYGLVRTEQIMEQANKYLLAKQIETAMDRFEQTKVSVIEILKMNQEQLQELYLVYQELTSGGDGVIEEPLD